MRVKFQFYPLKQNEIKIPVNYNEIVQGLIYSILPDEISNFVHNTGFKVGKRSFRLFTFSRIFGQHFYIAKSKELVFKNEFHIYFSTPVRTIIENLASQIIKEKSLKLGKNDIYLSSLSVEKTPEFDKEITFKMLSPVTVYSTLETKEGKKKTYYYSPFETEFSDLISENLRKKYSAFSGKDPGKMSVKIIPYRVNKNDMHIINYSDFIVKGWTGLYKMKGSKTLLKIADDCGIGSKNSQGFGMIEILRQRKDENK